MKLLSVVFAVSSLWMEIRGYRRAEGSPCLLTDDQPNSWVVGVREAKSSKLACAGSLIAKNYVVAPMTCFQKGPGDGFFEGSKFVVVAGAVGDECQQTRKGKLVMGHKELPTDRYKYNMAYLEVEPFDLDPINPPVMELPNSEKDNVEMVKEFVLEKAQCSLPLFEAETSPSDVKNQLSTRQVSLMSRGECWNKYCPSGNHGCLPFFWTTESYFCTSAGNDIWRRCWDSYAETGTPVICNGTAVGLLKICRNPDPLLIQGFNQEQLDAIEMYRKIASGKEEVEEDGVEQEEPPFPKENEKDEYP